MNTTINEQPVKSYIKFGVHTMMWGNHLTTERLKQMLAGVATVAKNVFGDIDEIGIEFAQKIHHLCCDITDDVIRAKTLTNIFQNEQFDGKNLPKLTLLSFSGRGSLKRRVDFCKILNSHGHGGMVPKYFLVHKLIGSYINNVDPSMCLVSQAMNLNGATLALHPFRFGPIDKIHEIKKELEKDQRIQFIPDTAHLWLANRTNFDWLFEENKLFRDRITAFHLKDWKKTYDSSLRYYSRGFTELGGGYLSNHADGLEVTDQRDSDLGLFCRKLNSAEFKEEKWCVFEQDYTVYDEIESLKQSFEWFKKIIGDDPVLPPVMSPKTSVRLPATIFFNGNCPLASEKESIKFDNRKRQVISELHHRASDNSEEFVVVLQDMLRYLFCGERKQEIDTETDAKNRPVHIAL